MPVEKQVADGWEPCLHREWNKGGSPVKRGKRAVFFVVLLCIAVLGYASFLGVSNTYGDLTRVYVKGAGDIPVSYTHLDVYKRQVLTQPQTVTGALV